MYILVFLVCISTTNCTVQSTDTPFISEAQCHNTAKSLIAINKQRQLDGVIPPHTARYACVNFGDSA